MNKLVLLFSAIFVFSANAYSASSDEEARFLASVKSAFERKDARAFLDLYFWDGVPDFIRSVAEKTTPDLLDSNVDTIVLVTAAPETGKEFVRNGVTYRNNLPVTKQIEVEHSPASKAKGKVTIPVGEKNGKLYITTAAPVKN